MLIAPAVNTILCRKRHPRIEEPVRVNIWVETASLGIPQPTCVFRSHRPSRTLDNKAKPNVIWPPKRLGDRTRSTARFDIHIGNIRRRVGSMVIIIAVPFRPLVVVETPAKRYLSLMGILS